MTTDNEFNAERERLEAEMETARALFLEVKTDKEHAEWQPRRNRLDRAMDALQEYRQYWRRIGQMAPDGHAGKRPAESNAFGIKVEDNVATEA